MIIKWNQIELEYNSPTWRQPIAETFDFKTKKTFITSWINWIIKYDNNHDLSFITQAIFKLLKDKASKIKLDYLQKLKINWKQAWCIDDWDVITLLLPDEY